MLAMPPNPSQAAWLRWTRSLCAWALTKVPKALEQKPS